MLSIFSCTCWSSVCLFLEKMSIQILCLFCFVLFCFFAIELYEFFIYFGCCRCCLVAKSYPTLCNSINYSPQVPLSIGFPRQEYSRGLSFPSPVDLPDPDQTHVSCLAGISCLAGTFFTTEPPGKSIFLY